MSVRLLWQTRGRLLFVRKTHPTALVLILLSLASTIQLSRVIRFLHTLPRNSTKSVLQCPSCLELFFTNIGMEQVLVSKPISTIRILTLLYPATILLMFLQWQTILKRGLGGRYECPARRRKDCFFNLWPGNKG